MRIAKIINGRKTSRNATDLDRNRIRFNWGYHDGAGEVKNDIRREQRCGADWQETHHDSVYIEGYRAGRLAALAGIYNGNSQDAWLAAGLLGTENDVTPYRL